jgi:hypothetical protein
MQANAFRPAMTVRRLRETCAAVVKELHRVQLISHENFAIGSVTPRRPFRRNLIALAME